MLAWPLLFNRARRLTPGPGDRSIPKIDVPYSLLTEAHVTSRGLRLELLAALSGQAWSWQLGRTTAAEPVSSRREPLYSQAPGSTETSRAAALSGGPLLSRISCTMIISIAPSAPRSSVFNLILRHRCPYRPRLHPRRPRPLSAPCSQYTVDRLQ